MLEEMPEPTPSISGEKFDEITGIKAQEPKETLADLSKVIAQGEAFIELKSTKGWKLIEEFLIMNKNSLTDSLIYEEKFSIIKNTQCLIKAFQVLPTIIEKALIDAEEAKKEVQNFLSGPVYDGIT